LPWIWLPMMQSPLTATIGPPGYGLS